jgi:NAD(P)-dependent dehydrogenase (short-subunit alcohol dehydrogenase family)
MKILVVGAAGTIGAAVTKALEPRHEVLRASFSRSPLAVDLGDPESIRRLFAKVGRVDAVVGAAGRAAYRPLFALTDADFALGFANKLMGQVDLVRLGIDAVADGGSFTLTAGIMSRQPAPGGAAITMVNAALEGFARAAALELPRGIRINTVSPGWLRESLVAAGSDPSLGTPVAVVVKRYVQAVEGTMTGQVIDAFAPAG